MYIVAKVFFAAVIVIVIPIIASWFTVSAIPKWATTVEAKEKTLSLLREYATSASSGRITVAVVVTTTLQIVITYHWRHAATVEDGIQWLFLASFIGVAASLYFSCLVLSNNSIVTCPGCQWLWGLLVIIAIWFGRAKTQVDLAHVFGAVSDKLPSATNVGVFLRSFGHVSVAMAIFMLFAEIFAIILYFGFEWIFGKSEPGNEMTRKRGWIAVFNTTAMMISAAISYSAASVLAFSDQPVRASIADVAFKTDLLAESACTGQKSDKNRKIIFRSDDREQAIVFSVLTQPGHDEGSERSSIQQSIVHWQTPNYEHVMPKAIEIDRDCKLVDVTGQGTS
ncbi:hypothetical protein [Burkholderia stagnalis]|uniref:hypothetical protein n=1 Tax=Burkholderia stagnalis TaxID=1503054 RepID=UPI000F57070D|nr:hypothetical protein [Burkholderia stagnalis]